MRGQFQIIGYTACVFPEHDMDGDDVRIKTVGTRTENDVGAKSSESPVPPAPDMIGNEPPDIVGEVRTRKSRNLVPSYFSLVDVPNFLTVDVNLELVRQSGDPFRDAALGPVALVERRADDKETRL